MTVTVSVVIPTIGRPTLTRAVRSALDQTSPVAEVIVVADTDRPVALPSDDRIVMVRCSPGSGPARCRQRGIEAARGSVIALLDDDDEWYESKLERQLAAVGDHAGTDWVASSRIAVHGPGQRRRMWPRRLIEPGQSVTDYLFRVSDLGAGGAVLQTSTLCFPADLARRVPWDGHAGAVHDEPSWLIQVQRNLPGLRLIQLPEVLSVYHVGYVSASRSQTDRTGEYISWGLQYLDAESPRVLGDYLCTSPVSAAVAAGSVRGARRSLRSAVKHGRPGRFAVMYAVLSVARILVRRSLSVIRR